MRAMARSCWVLLLAAFVFVGWAPACSLNFDGRPRPGDETTDETTPDETTPDEATPDDDPLPFPTATEGECPGKCVAQPPAPFNARIHLMWFGVEAFEHECPEIAPLPGFSAAVLSTAMNGNPERNDGPWVRECLISNDSDPCPEGETCALAPPGEDYQLCISRELNGPCPDDYYPRHVVAQEPGEPVAAPVTLCCARDKLR
jgi:hypothetical protein